MGVETGIQPQRIQLRRSKGWRMPANTLKVDRTTVFGNPFSVEQHGRAGSVRMYRLWLEGKLPPPLFQLHHDVAGVVFTLLLGTFFGIGYLIHRYEQRQIDAAELALPGPLEGVIFAPEQSAHK